MKLFNFKKEEFYTIPNILTYLRLLLVPVFIALLMCNYIYTALTVAVVAMLTDGLDGFIARHCNMQTNLGKLLDPLADKCLKTSAIICFGIKNIIPIWLLIVFLILDLFLIVSSVIILKQGIIIKANYIGKLGTLLVFMGIVLCFFYDKVGNANVIMLICGLAIYVLSCVSYVITYFLRRKNAKINNEE